MATWFGHTQTVATISKSVSTVAGGIIGLETNLSNFMKKVVYFDKFFQRNSDKLPTVVITTATRLFKRCYEYRDEIREELESSVAYVADAGRWVVGLDDWNTRMERRMSQITELVVLATSLLAEFNLTGKIGPANALEDLNLYVGTILETIVLQNEIIDSGTEQPDKTMAVAKDHDDDDRESAISSDNEQSNPFCESNISIVVTSIPEEPPAAAAAADLTVSIDLEKEKANPFSEESIVASPVVHEVDQIQEILAVSIDLDKEQECNPFMEEEEEETKSPLNVPLGEKIPLDR